MNLNFENNSLFEFNDPQIGHCYQHKKIKIAETGNFQSWKVRSWRGRLLYTSKRPLLILYCILFEIYSDCFILISLDIVTAHLLWVYVCYWKWCERWYSGLDRKGNPSMVRSYWKEWRWRCRLNSACISQVNWGCP